MRRLLYFARVALGGHVFNALWRPRLQRRQARGRAIWRASKAYLRPYVKAAEAVPEDRPDRTAPRRVFTLWLQGPEQAPPVIRCCLDSIRRYAGAELVVLDGKTVFDWITLSDHVVQLWKTGKMRAAHFADICRVELLYRYGGVWMAYAGIQNCFIRAAKGSYLLKVWREAMRAYWAAEDSTVDYFVHQLLFSQAVAANPRAAELYAQMPSLDQDPIRRLWHDYGDKPYDEALLHEVCSQALFQKTSYKGASATDPVPGSMIDHILAPYR